MKRWILLGGLLVLSNVSAEPKKTESFRVVDYSAQSSAELHEGQKLKFNKLYEVKKGVRLKTVIPGLGTAEFIGPTSFKLAVNSSHYEIEIQSGEVKVHTFFENGILVKFPKFSRGHFLLGKTKAMFRAIKVLTGSCLDGDIQFIDGSSKTSIVSGIGFFYQEHIRLGQLNPGALNEWSASSSDIDDEGKVIESEHDATALDHNTSEPIEGVKNSEDSKKPKINDFEKIKTYDATGGTLGPARKDQNIR